MSAADVLTPESTAFLTELQRAFGERRREALARRAERAGRLAAGELPDFLAETEDVRSGDWRIAPFPDEIADRRVEITGPVDRKMVINALNSGARVFMADFEDSNAPTWENCVTGQANITCTCGPGESMSVAWFLFETLSGTVLGSQYADSISGDGGAGERTIVATIDRVVSLAPGTHSISLHVVPQNTSGFGTPADPTSIAADLAVIGIGAAP